MQLVGLVFSARKCLLVFGYFVGSKGLKSHGWDAGEIPYLKNLAGASRCYEEIHVVSALGGRMGAALGKGGEKCGKTKTKKDMKIFRVVCTLTSTEEFCSPFNSHAIS